MASLLPSDRLVGPAGDDAVCITGFVEFGVAVTGVVVVRHAEDTVEHRGQSYPRYSLRETETDGVFGLVGRLGVKLEPTAVKMRHGTKNGCFASVQVAGAAEVELSNPDDVRHGAFVTLGLTAADQPNNGTLGMVLDRLSGRNVFRIIMSPFSAMAAPAVMGADRFELPPGADNAEVTEDELKAFFERSKLCGDVQELEGETKDSLVEALKRNLPFLPWDNEAGTLRMIVKR